MSDQHLTPRWWNRPIVTPRHIACFMAGVAFMAVLDAAW